MQARLQRPVAFLNDADAAGIAEMTLGAGRDRAGTVMVITLGTGIGTALFVDGRLLPNTELGHLEVRGKEAEHRASAKVRADLDLDWVEWAAEVNEVLEAYHSLLWPDVFVIGGGVTENWQHFGSLLSSRAEIVPAAFGNDAGIVGAAMAAVAVRALIRPLDSLLRGANSRRRSVDAPGVQGIAVRRLHSHWVLMRATH